MPNVPIGSQNNDGSRTPTLREFIKSGRSLPRNCSVQIIFKPNKTPAYGFVCYPGFRVSVNEGSELFDAIEDGLEEWISGDTHLVVSPDTSSPGKFELSVDTNETATWKEFEWGFKLTGGEKRKTTRSRKKPTDVQERVD